MKAKVLATGEILNNVILGNTSCEVYTVEGVNEKGQRIMYDSTLVSILPDSIQEGGQQNREVDWEQRRYEIAKDIYCACLTNSDYSLHRTMKESVEDADALIEELKKEKK